MELLGIYDFSDALRLIKQDPAHLAMKLSYWDECYIKIVLPSDNEYEAYFALYTAEGSAPFILQYSDILCGTWELLKLDTMDEDTPDSAPEEAEGEEDYGNSEESELESEDTHDSAPEEKKKDFSNLSESELEEIPGFGLAFDVAVKMLSHLRDDGFTTIALRRKGWKYPERYITFNMSDTEDENIYTEIGVPYCASITDIVSTDWYLISL